MLGKLLKHEWRAVWKVPVLLYGVLLLTGLIAGLTFSMPIWDSDWVGLPMSGVMLILMFYFALIGVSVGITIYFAVRYYKSMFTDEGYLTHTLPVSARELLLNKVITMGAWNLITMAAIVLALIVFGGTALLALKSGLGEFSREVFKAFSELPELLDEPYMEGFEGFCASIIWMMLATAFSGTMMLIGSITLGQMVRKHRILGSIGAYFGIQAITQTINTVVIMPFMFTVFEDWWWDVDSPFYIFTGFYVVMSLVTLAVAVGLYFLCEYLIRKKLELE